MAQPPDAPGATAAALPAPRCFLVTGCAGFIGSAFVRLFLRWHPEPDIRVIGLDKLTYAGNLDNLKDVQQDPRFRFIRGDICDRPLLRELLPQVDAVLNFAAETHVDRAILDADAFVQTNFVGVNTLLDTAKNAWLADGVSPEELRRTKRFIQVSTDEVYGNVLHGAAGEDWPLAPRNPYAASKAGAELLARSYFISFGLPVVITRGNNTIGPYQYPEKVTPLFITNAIDDQPLPIYGTGQAVRDYIYVDDHCSAIDLLLWRGEPGEAYNIGAIEGVNTVRLATAILDLLGKPRRLIQFVGDRPGHDYRYWLDSSKLRALGWAPGYDFATALRLTVEWYCQNQWWWRKLKTGEYLEYYRRNYGPKLTAAR